MLLAAGADIHQKDQNGFTPLAAALRHPHYELPEIIALFQHYGADFNAKNKAGRSILQIAERNFAEPEIIELLRVEHELSNISFTTWIQPLKVYDVVDNTVFCSRIQG